MSLKSNIDASGESGEGVVTASALSCVRKFFRPQTKRRAYPWWTYVLLAVFAPVAIWGPQKALVTTTASVPYRIWWKAEMPPVEQIEKGQYLAFNRVHPWTDKKSETLMVKRISCAPGQKLEIKGLNYYCDGRWLGEALVEDSKGSPWPGLKPPALCRPANFL